MAKKSVVQNVIEIPSEYSPEERDAIAIELLRYIRERTANGLGPGGKKWSGGAGKYSQSYIDSLNFRIGRKDKGKVNLTLEGDMLEELTLINQKPGKIRYGYDPSNDQADKAEGNILGTYGRKTPNRNKARPFLDLTQKEINDILDMFPLEDPAALEEAVQANLSAKDAAGILTDKTSKGSS